MLLTPSRERWVLAVHEAGHAVIGQKVSFTVTDVEIENARRCCARPEWQYDNPASGISAETADEVESDALYTLAGGKAEIYEPAGKGIAEFAAKDDEYFKSLRPGYDRQEPVLEWRKRMHAAAAMLVHKHWTTIEAVARALYESEGGRLSGAEVRRIITDKTVSKSV